MSNSARQPNYPYDRSERNNRDYYEDEEYSPRVSRLNTRVPNPNMRPGVPVYHLKGDTATRGNIAPPQPLDNQPTRGYSQSLARVPATPRQQRMPTYPTAPKFSQPSKKSVMSPMGKTFLLNSGNRRMFLWVAGAVILAIVSFIVISAVVSWFQVWQDDMKYGRPRTMQSNAFVGHNEQGGKASHFIAQNIDGQVNIIQYPGNDTTKTRVIQGPRLFGKNAALAPVILEFQDVNTDSHVDLIVNVDGQKLIYVNEAGSFRPIREDERSRVRLGGDK
jgi:hypothetical protein